MSELDATCTTSDRRRARYSRSSFRGLAGAASEVDGVGKIFVHFSDLTGARKFQYETNGRTFEDRVVAASFYPVDKFDKGEYTLRD